MYTVILAHPLNQILCGIAEIHKYILRIYSCFCNRNQVCIKTVIEIIIINPAINVIKKLIIGQM